MSNSSLTLYWGTPLTPARNLKVDDITTFLSSYTSKNIAKYQYIKHALDIEIKVDLSQGQQDLWQVPLTPARSKLNFINYLSITNSNSTTGANEFPVYYFVLKVTPRAEKTIALTCHMDVINTYKGGTPNGYELSDRTIIHRQHVDRFKWNEDGDGLIPLVDYVDEGIHPLLVKTPVEEKLPLFAGTCWNLIYRNIDNIDEAAFNQVNPVTAWLVPDSSVQVEFQSSGGLSFQAGDFPSDYTLIDATMNGNTSIFFHIDNDPTYERAIQRGAGVPNAYMIVYVHGGQMDITLRACSPTLQAGGTLPSGTLTWSHTWTNVTSIKFEVNLASIKGNNTSSVPLTFPATTNTTLTDASTGTEYTKSIEDIDRKDSKIIKIISLPYPPADGFISAGKVYFIRNFYYDHGDKVFKLLNDNGIYDFSANITMESNYTPLSRLETIYGIDPDPEEDDFGIVTDPKFQCASEFFRSCFVYDSFVQTFDLERVDVDKWTDNYDLHTWALKYVVSSTFNSKFMFIFPEYIDCLKYPLVDYEGVLPIARNNELPIFSNQYNNYLRTAYRYDLKNVERSKTTALIQGLSSAGSAIASAFSGNALGFGAGVFGVINAVQGAQRAEEGLKAKIAQLENQATSISQADDIDLLKVYTEGGMPKLTFYEPIPNSPMVRAILRLFHFCGYAREDSGIPDETSRIWFNFVQAELEFKNPKETPTWALEEIKNRYAVGVTILHKYSGEYDPDQTKENWERALIE